MHCPPSLCLAVSTHILNQPRLAIFRSAQISSTCNGKEVCVTQDGSNFQCLHFSRQGSRKYLVSCTFVKYFSRHSRVFFHHRILERWTIQGALGWRPIRRHCGLVLFFFFRIFVLLARLFQQSTPCPHRHTARRPYEALLPIHQRPFQFLCYRSPWFAAVYK